MDFENGVKNIQAVAYNGARTVLINHWSPFDVKIHDIINRGF